MDEQLTAVAPPIDRRTVLKTGAALTAAGLALLGGDQTNAQPQTNRAAMLLMLGLQAQGAWRRDQRSAV